VPAADVIAVLLNPNNPNLPTRLRDVQEAARSVSQQILVLYAGSEKDIEVAFANIVQQHAAALLIGDDPFLAARTEQIVSLAARYAIPTSFTSKDMVRAGGLMSYGDDRSESMRNVGRLAVREKI
jgi:putative ABC transport system substrate-binding protein